MHLSIDNLHIGSHQRAQGMVYGIPGIPGTLVQHAVLGVILAVVADLVAGIISVVRHRRLYPFGVLVYVVTVPVLST